jgi:hypothetical protein
VINIMPQPIYPRERTWHPLNRWLVGPQSKSGHFREEFNLLPLPEFALWIIQPMHCKTTVLNTLLDCCANILATQLNSCTGGSGKSSIQPPYHKHTEIYPLLNFLNGGRITACLLMMQYRPARTLARSPRIIASDCTITLPLKTIFCDPHKTVWRLTLLPDA